MINHKITGLLSILCCPHCFGNLIYQDKTNEFWCIDSKLAFPIIDDIPVMLVDESKTLTTEDISTFKIGQNV